MFIVVYKGTESLFFRLKILFNWKIIVVEVTETFLSPWNHSKKRAIMARERFGGGHLSIVCGIHAMAHSGWNTADCIVVKNSDTC